jgi:CelD/BcsL family acetyltransferase involved in cellulose biosynthesis
MRLDAYTKADSLGSLADEWRGLLQTAIHNSIFATPEWAETWWRSFGDGRELCLLTLREGNELVGIVPLFIERDGQRRLVRFLGGVDVTDYEDIIARPGTEGDVWQQALEYLDGHHLELDLHNVPGQSATVAFFRQLSRDDRYVVAVQEEDVCPTIDPLPADWESYLEALPRKERHELRRKLRRLMGDPDLDAQLCWQQPDLRKAMDDFVRLHRLSSPDKSEFMTPRMVGFFNGVAQMCREHGWLCLGFLTIDNTPVSAIMAFDYGDTFYLYNSGYDPAYDELSVGLLLKAQSIEHAIVLGKKRYDFLQGSERYKYDLGGQNTYVYQISCVRR